jgi:hypothetical protein
MFVRAIDQCERKIPKKHPSCSILCCCACQWVCEGTSCGILNSFKKSGSKPWLNSTIVGNFSKNLKPCRLDKQNTIHCKI